MNYLFSIGIFSLLIFSCDSSNVTKQMGCDGVVESGLIEDECGICGRNNIGENIYTDENCGEYAVELWGECYLIKTTTELDLSLHELSNLIENNNFYLRGIIDGNNLINTCEN